MVLVLQRCLHLVRILQLAHPLDRQLVLRLVDWDRQVDRQAG